MQTVAFRIGTRGSPLALRQAETVRARLAEAVGEAAELEIVPIRTSGDKVTDRPLADIGGKGLFTKEIDEALHDGRIDIAVHSAKDIETDLAEGLAIGACLEREDVRDAFVSPAVDSFDALPEGATLGTSSARRAAFALHRRPDLAIVPMRGNVETRLQKLADGEAAATLVAVAGLNRLDLAGRATRLMPVDDWLPAAGQGTVAVTVRADDGARREVLAGIDHRPTAIALAAERAFLAVLDGSCRTPIGGLARLAGDGLRFDGAIASADGAALHRVRHEGKAGEAGEVGRAAARELLARAGPGFVDAE